MLVATAFGRTVVDAEVAVGNLLRQFFALGFQLCLKGRIVLGQGELGLFHQIFGA